MGISLEKINKMLLFSVLVGSSLSLPALQRTGRQYCQQPSNQYYQQQVSYNQYPYYNQANNNYNNQDWGSSSSSSSPNVQFNGNFNDDVCQDEFLGSLLDIGKSLIGSLFGGGGGLFGGAGGGGMGMNMNMQGGGNRFGNTNGNTNINTGHMDGGSQVNTNNGSIQQQNGLDVAALLQSLLGAFTQSKSFNGQNQFINKQTGQSAS